MDAPTVDNALIRIQKEFLEMPGLNLAPNQIGRLCGLTRDAADAALQHLVDRGFLRQSRAGQFMRAAAWISPHPVIVA